MSRKILTVAAAAVLTGVIACATPPRVPHSLSDQEFSQLAEGLSEPAGTFTDSENLVSNEKNYVNMIPMFDDIGGVYVGVGPEQNFSYIAAVEPAIAFIVDIRRENRSLHLLYKALFEISADRAEFLSRLFSRERPAGLDRDSAVQTLFAGFGEVQPSADLRIDTARLVRERLLETHAFSLSSDDLAWINHVLEVFHDDGPQIRYEAERPNNTPTLREVLTATDAIGMNSSFLATEESFRAVKDLQTRNLIVPLVGDFGGRDTLRHVADYARAHDAIVSVFYASNVQVYLNREKRDAFCDNLEALPSGPRSWFVASNAMQRLQRKLENCRLN